MKIDFSTRWNGDKTSRIVTLKNWEELSSLTTPEAFQDFLAIFISRVKRFGKYPNLTHTFDHKMSFEILQLNNEWSAEDWEIMRIVINGLINSNVGTSLEKCFRIIDRTHGLLGANREIENGL